MGMYCALFGRFDSDPTRESCYKDAITIPHYVERSRAYAGTQRMGIRDERPGALSICAHVRGAMEAPFFCAQEADSNPPPTHTHTQTIRDTVDIVARAPTEDIPKFRGIKNEQRPVLENGLTPPFRSPGGGDWRPGYVILFVASLWILGDLDGGNSFFTAPQTRAHYLKNGLILSIPASDWAFYVLNSCSLHHLDALNARIPRRCRIGLPSFGRNHSDSPKRDGPRILFLWANRAQP